MEEKPDKKPEKKEAKAAAANTESSKKETKAPANPETEAYQKLRKSLKGLLAKKLSIDQDLEKIEERIFVEEGAYLQDASAGNIVKGFDQYTKSSQNRRRSVLVEQDRIFSQSSTSFEAEN